MRIGTRRLPVILHHLTTDCRRSLRCARINISAAMRLSRQIQDDRVKSRWFPQRRLFTMFTVTYFWKVSMLSKILSCWSASPRLLVPIFIICTLRRYRPLTSQRAMALFPKFATPLRPPCRHLSQQVGGPVNKTFNRKLNSSYIFFFCRRL